MGKGGGKVEVTDYNMSMHYGICAGPVDALRRIVVKEKDAWDGTLTDLNSFSISLPEMFGGNKKEGGIGGVITYLPGALDQVLPDWLAVKLGRPSGAECPGYRGLASVFFTGASGSTGTVGSTGKGGAYQGAQAGFYWTSNNPYLPGTWCTVQRAPVGLTASLAMIEAPSLDMTGATAWRYLPIALGDSTNRAAVDFDDSTWLIGSSPFGNNNEADPPSATYLAPNTAAWLRCHASSDVTSITFNIDDQVQLYYNGVQIGGTYGIPGATVALTPAGNDNVIAIRLADTGGEFIYFNDDLPHVAAALAGPNANGAHIIYECLTNTDWGMGSPEVAIDVDSFEAAAQTLFDERFGLSMIWTRQAKIEDFIQEVLDHIQGVVYVDPSTGLLTLMLIRGDYLAGSYGAPQALNIDANDFSGANTTSGGLTVTMAADQYLVITKPLVADSGGLLDFDGWSDWSSDGSTTPGPPPVVGQTWDNYFYVFGSNGGPETLVHDFSTDIDRDLFTTEAGAYAALAAVLPASFTGYTSYRITCQTDPHLGDNRGGLSLLAQVHTPPTVLPELTPDNADLTSFSRKLWGEIVNEIVVTWTNPENEQDETVTVQDLAAMEIQGGPVSDSRNYYGVRNADLAQMLGWRDLRSAGQPLASCHAEVDRTLWRLRPASVVKVTWPEYGLDQIVMRVTNIDYGKPGEPTIKLDLIEDVYGLDIGDYESPPSTEWIDTSASPQPVETVEIVTLPLFMAANSPVATFVDSPEYPEVVAGVLATTEAADTSVLELWDEVTLANGSTEWTKLANLSVVGRAALGVALAREATTAGVTFTDEIGQTIPVVAGFVIIGADGETGNEIAIVDATDYTLTRGVLDTVPRAWPLGTAVRFVDSSTLFEDSLVRAAGEVVDYKIRSRTSTGLLPLESATLESYTLTDRPWLPNRPAKVQAYGEAWTSASDPADAILRPDPWVTVTWANRNRLLEDSQVLSWTDADVTPETGQTTTIEVRSFDGATVITTHDGLTGTSFDVPDASFGSEEIVRLRTYSKRSDGDGDFVSLQFFDQWVQVGPLTADATRVTADTTHWTADEG